MYSQLFSPIDLFILLLLFVFEALLSVDNATVIAVLAKKLPKDRQDRALWIGLSSGLVLRGCVVIGASSLLHFEWIIILGGCYLFYLALHHFLSHSEHIKKIPQHPSFWKTVIMIEGADVIFAIDSILTAFAMLLVFYPLRFLFHKLWIVYVAGLLGMVTMRFFSKALIRLLESYPVLEKLSYFFVGWIGIKLIADGIFAYVSIAHVYAFIDFLFITGSLGMVVWGCLKSKKIL